MQPPKSAYWISAFGWLNITAAAAIAITSLVAPTLFNGTKDGLFFTLGLQVAVSAGLVFTGRQLNAGTDLGHKAYPAALVAYGLFLLMAARWLTG